jgi:hypothetical protein
VSEETEQPSVKVSDRRRFSSDGEPLEREEASGSESPPESKSAGGAEADAEPSETRTANAPPRLPDSQASDTRQTPPIPDASLEMLILSLGMQAQMELMPSPGDEGPPPNLEVARHTIDLLSILKDKTKGNLDFEESRLLDNTLTELRFRYVQRVNEINEKAKG